MRPHRGEARQLEEAALVKLFGEYLVEKGVVTAEQLVAALMEQLCSTPLVAEVVFAHKLLGVGDFLRTMAHQHRSGLNFQAAAESLDLWTPAIEAAVLGHIRAVRKPLGEVLVEMEVLSLNDLTSSLDAYVEYCGRERDESKMDSAMRGARPPRDSAA